MIRRMAGDLVFVRVHITRGPAGMKYPPRYDAREVDAHGVGPLNVLGDDAYSGGISLGGPEEWCLILLPAALAAEYATDADMVPISLDEAEADVTRWHAEKVAAGLIGGERVTDAGRLQAITAKQGAGLKLSESDLRALDPDDPTPGINAGVRSLRIRFGARLKTGEPVA